VAEVLPATTPATAHISSIINRGTMVNAETATLNVENNAGTKIINVPFVNAYGAIWNINAGDLTVQFDVTNYGTVNIANSAEYHQDVYGTTPTKTTFTNEANSLPGRFLANPNWEVIGKVNNNGVFAVTGTSTTKGVINNYGLIEHANDNAKTYITNNQLGGAFGTAFGAANKMGRINLTYGNRDEDNVSISAAAANGFVSVTVNGEASIVGSNTAETQPLGKYVNYIIINSGVTEIQKLNAQYKYVEINQPGTEIAWSTTAAATYNGLIVLSPVNIKYGTSVTVSDATYINAKMYVGGTFTNTGWSGYYGNTTDNVVKNYITY